VKESTLFKEKMRKDAYYWVIIMSEMNDQKPEMIEKPEELLRAEKLIDEGKLDEAHQLIKNFEEKGGHTLHDNILCHLLNCELLYWRGLYEDVVKLAEQTYKHLKVT